jgi:hypothetical protein
VNKLEFVRKINEQSLNRLSSSVDKLELISCSKKIKRTELEHSILGLA